MPGHGQIGLDLRLDKGRLRGRDRRGEILFRLDGWIVALRSWAYIGLGLACNSIVLL